jgi:hypothetical protein
MVNRQRLLSLQPKFSSSGFDIVGGLTRLNGHRFSLKAQRYFAISVAHLTPESSKQAPTLPHKATGSPQINGLR